MLISVTLQTHPRRAEIASKLAAALDASLTVDPDPDAYPSPWRTYRRALADTPPGATHRVVIQDDAYACPNFRAALDLVVAARPDRLIALFVGGAPRESRDAIFEACQRDETFADLPHGRWIPTVALVWPVALIEPVLGYVDAQRWPVEFHADDEIIGRASVALDFQAIATVPSLIEHPDVEPSLVRKAADRRGHGGADRDRVAACFIAGDPLDIPWR